MRRFLQIVRYGYTFIAHVPGRVALYVALSLVTQTVIPVALIPTLLARVTNSVAPRVSRSAEGDQKKTQSVSETNGREGSKTELSPQQRQQEISGPISIRTPYLEWLFLVLALLPLGIWFRLAQNDLDNAMEFEIRKKIFDNVLHQPPEFFRSHNPGELTNVLTQMVTQTQQAYRSLCLEPVMQAISLALAIYLIINDLKRMNGSVVWVAVSAILLIGFLTVYLVQMRAKDAVAKSQVDLQRQMLNISGLATSVMSVPQDIQIMNAEPLFSRRYSDAIQSLFEKKRKQILTVEAVNLFLGFPTQLILACLFGFVVYAVTNGKPGADPGTIVAFSYLVPRLMEPFKTFAALGLTASSAWPAVEVVTLLSNQPSRVTDLPGAIEVDRMEPTIEGRNLSFQYDGAGKKIFDDVSFVVPSGKITGLIARFGQGKTTFFRLALRLYDLQGGEILLGGRPTTSFTLKSLRRQISMMAQSPAFFDLTIRENFQVAKPGATDDEIRLVAEKTGLWPILVQSFGPNPLDQQFHSGMALSGGQKRKFSLTYSLLRDAQIVFLDEPSTNLSADDLQDLVSTIKSSCAGKTVIVVDHILPAFIAPLCDYVLVLENGHIIERGTPDELLVVNGVYRELYEAQLPRAHEHTHISETGVPM
jgi:ABC-type multidrug transport system fused ATPase/permease subunit